MKRKESFSIFNLNSRWDVFKFTYKTHFTFLMKLSFLLTLFAIPLFVTLVLKGLFLDSVLKGMNESNQAKVLYQYFSLDIYLSLLYIPSLLIFSIGLSGAYTLIKKYSFQEGYIFSKTFFLGIKENVKKFLGVTLFYSIVFYLILFTRDYISILNFKYYLPSTLVVVIFLILLLCNVIFAYGQIPIYTNSVFRTIKNAFLFTFYALPKTFLVFLGTMGPLLIVSFFSNTILSAITILVYTIIGFGHMVLATSLFTESYFDKVINETQFPSIYRKGLYQLEEDDKEKEDDD